MRDFLYLCFCLSSSHWFEVGGTLLEKGDVMMSGLLGSLEEEDNCLVGDQTQLVVERSTSTKGLNLSANQMLVY